MHRVSPSLFFDDAWIERFRRELVVNETLRTEWQRWEDAADRLLIEDFVDEAYADEIDSQHGRYDVPSHQMAKMGVMLGTAYHVTGDRKYAEKLKEALLYYARYRKWHGKGLARKDPAWHSELNTARFCYGFAVGYDCLRGLLNDRERTVIRDALVRLGIVPVLKDWIWPETRIHALDSMGHNWWIVCVSQAGLAALALLDEEPRAREWVSDIVAAIPWYFHYQGSVLGHKSPNYDEAGAFYESVNYARYGLYEYLVFRLALSRAPGFSVPDADIPVLKRIGEFFLHTFYPSDKQPLTVNFGDGHIRQTASDAVKLLLANGFEDPRLRWLLRQCDEPWTVYDFFAYDRIWEGEVREPETTAVLYDRIGWTVMRTGWGPRDTLLAVKSGFTWNHAHADAGSFVLFHQGVPLLVDSGNCSYEKPEYIEYYLQSRAHNVVLFDGEGQDPDDLYRGVQQPGRLYHLIDHDGWRYVYADATGPMARHFSRNYRHFVWLDGVVLIYDDVRAHREGRMDWLFHYEGSAERQADGSFRITHEDAGVVMKPLFPRHLLVTCGEGLADHDPDRNVPYLILSTAGASREAKFLTAVLPVPAGGEGSLPKVAATEGDEWIGAVIASGGKRTEVYVNLRADGRIMHRNSIKTIAGWETDAYMLAVTRNTDRDPDDPDAVERLLVVYGSFLRRNGRVLFSSLSKATMACSMSGEELQVSICGQAEGVAEIRPARVPVRVWINRRPAEPPVVCRGGGILIRFMTNLISHRPG
jgi:hypothetical protein